MARNYFGQASRFAAKLDPVGFWSWSLRLKQEQFAFRRWLDTRSIPFPGETDRTVNTVAWIDDPITNLTPWAVAAEFQIEPDPLMFGRLLVYLGDLWLAMKPDAERGSRFNLGAVVINLTGKGYASRRMEWPSAGLTTHLGVTERNMAHENADELLNGIESGNYSRGLLPWLPLMTGGDDQGIIDRWKSNALTEPNSRMRSEYGGLALIFADAAERRNVWTQALKGWNVKESSVVNEWLQEGRAEGRQLESAAAVITALRTRFKQVPTDIATAITNTTNISTLQSWLPLAIEVPSLDEFRKLTLNQSSNP
jgi:hypothetical protein